MNKRVQLAAINQSIAHVSEIYETYVTKQGMAYPSFLVLYKLYTQGTLTQREIGLQHHIPKQTVHNNVLKLLAQNQVVLKENPLNRREKFVQLTPLGKETIAEIVEPLLKMEEIILDRLGEEDTQSLIRINQRYADILKEVMEIKDEH
jgi:DNA-binding MarR family transcriptional regulator